MRSTKLLIPSLETFVGRWKRWDMTNLQNSDDDDGNEKRLEHQPTFSPPLPSTSYSLSFSSNSPVSRSYSSTFTFSFSVTEPSWKGPRRLSILFKFRSPLNLSQQTPYDANEWQTLAWSRFPCLSHVPMSISLLIIISSQISLHPFCTFFTTLLSP